MVKHTQTIRRQFADELFECVWPFCGTGAQRVKLCLIIVIAISLVFNDLSSSVEELLEKDKSVTIHHPCLQILAYEIFKVKNNMAPEILTEKEL